jgi:hypothetical protein
VPFQRTLHRKKEAGTAGGLQNAREIQVFAKENSDNLRRPKEIQNVRELTKIEKFG